ncbi:retrovirus-related pol polyprotein from transposon TNT 1-94 [Tanacetum coccineum]
MAMALANPTGAEGCGAGSSTVGAKVFSMNVGDEGGFAPNIQENKGLELLKIAIAKTGYSGKDLREVLIIILYVEDNEENVVQSNVSSVQNDALMSILNEMHEDGIQQGIKSRLANKPNTLVNDSLTSELARYKELVRMYEQRARLKERVKIRFYAKRLVVQMLHVCKPKMFYDEKNKVAIGYKNPLCLTRAKQVQSTLYNGNEIVMTNHARAVVHDSEDTLEIAEITRKRMLEKMKSPLCVDNKVKIAPLDYSKENLLATFAPQRDLTPEQLFWSKDENNRKTAETSGPKPLSALTVYPPNTPVMLVPRVLPTKSQVKINLYVLTQLFTEFDKTCKKRITPTGVTEGERGFEQTKRCYLTEVIPFFKTLKEHFAGVQTALFKEVKVMEGIFDQMSDEVDQNAVDKQCAKIVKKNLFIEKENLIANCLTNQLLYDMEKSRCLDLEAEKSKIKNLEHQIQEKDNVIRDLKVLVSNVNDRSCEPSNAKNVTALLEQNERFRAEIEKESVEIVREIVEEARVVKPLDTAFNSAFPLEASGSKPRSNSKHDRILLAKSVNKKKVEDHPRTNKSVWTKVNRVDSSISSKRVVINSISESVCKTCNKCLNFSNHEMCVVNMLKSVNGTPTVKIVLNKGKQIWKPKGKLSDNSLNKTQWVWKATGKLLANVGYQWRPTGKKFTLGKLTCDKLTCDNRFTTVVSVGAALFLFQQLAFHCRTGHPLVSGLRLFKTYDGDSLWAQELCMKSLIPETLRHLQEGEDELQPGSLSGHGLLNIHAFWEGGGMGVQVKFSSQTTTTALSIENGSVCEGECEFKIYFITQVYNRSDWEDLPWLFGSVVCYESNSMAEQNVPAQAPTRTDEQILSVDILRNTNFFSAFSALASVPAIYIQQFWNTMKYDEKTRVYSCQLDEKWFNLSADLLRKALDITPTDPAHPFEQPPTGNVVIDFMNQLGYPEPVEFVSKIRTFFSHKASHKASLKDPKKKAVPLLIPYGRFTKMIIYYLGSTSDVHRRPESPRHLPGDDFLLGNLKFISKGEIDEVFGMAIPKQLITEAIQQSSYYPKYLEMVAKNTKKTPQESASKQPEPAPKCVPPKKPTTTTPVKPTKPASSKQPKSPKKKSSKITPSRKVRKGKPSLQLVDEESEAQQEPEPQREGDDPALELAKKLSLETHQEKGEGQAPVGGVAIREHVAEEIPKLPEVVGKGKAIVTEEQVAHSLIDLSKKKRTTDQFILQRRDQASHDSTTGPSSQPQDDTSEKVVHESSSTTNSERTERGTEATAPKVDKEQGEVASSIVKSKVGISIRTEDQARSDPEKAHEALAGPDLEPMQEDQTGSDSGKEHVTLVGPNPEHMDEDFYTTTYPKVHENLKLRTDKHVTKENPENDQEKSNVVDKTDSIIPDPSDQTDTSAPPVTTPVIGIPSPKPSSQVTTPPINTEATTITTILPEITPFIALQLRVAKLEQDMSEVKKTDHSAAVLASIQSQVPKVVDNYLGTKVDDALLKALEKHTADLIQKYSVLPGLESSKKQESKKSPEEIIRIKREQGEKKQESTYTIKSTDKAALEEFDLKSALFTHMHKNRTANRNPANYQLYHALMEALIQDENAIDKEVADKVKDHKRKHDSDDDEDDDDDEGPSAGSNQGKSTKRRRHDSGASGSAQPPKDDEQSTKTKQDSDASASRQHPAFTSTAWQITDTRDATIDSSMHRSEPELEYSKHSSDDASTRDEGHVSDLEDTNNAYVPKVPDTTTWFKPIPEEERPATPEPEWTIPPNDFPEPENNWANAYTTSRTGKKKLCKADLEGPTFNLVKAFHKNSVSLQFQMDECHKLLTNKVDLVNPEGQQILHNINEPLPLGGPPGDKERKTALSISKLKAARYLDFGLEELVPSLWVESERDYDVSAAYGITHWWFRRKQFYINKLNEPSDREAVRSLVHEVSEHLSDTKDHLKMEMEMEIPSSSNVKLISECSDTTYTCYEVMKDLIKVSKLPQTLISSISSQVHKMA